MDVRPLRDTLRKCRNRENETPDQWQQRLERDRMSKRIKRASENAQQREKRLNIQNKLGKNNLLFRKVLGSSLPENGPLDDQILRLL
ncbi:uncharacterized protein OCT59_027638 [Rhizophagus irregularis]|uniref:uncharacterized protein n=1 Tax=Rhizophagus irregularis TaxID=588596 RepID=UPI00332AA890|nr:hypothetical protein OCT59_027638 [Rhizophagus irregularis]